MNLKRNRELQGLGLIEFCNKYDLSLAYVIALEAGLVPLNGEFEILEAYKISKEVYDSHYIELTEGSNYTPYRVLSYAKRKISDVVNIVKSCRENK